MRAYADHAPDGLGGVVVQQSTEDADAEVWNLAYSDPAATELLDTGRLAFELKVGQGAKPGLGGMTVVSRAAAAAVAEQYAVDAVFGPDAPQVLRCSSPGTFTDEILRQQIRLMRNNFPRARVWVKLPPGRDIGAAAAVAWAAGADAVTVDGAEGGTGWAPLGFLDHVGLPLAECLRRIGTPRGCLLASGRMWAGPRAAKTLALGATAVGLGRAALIAADTDAEHGLTRLLECLALEMRLLISALGKYTPAALDNEDIWLPGGNAPADPRGEQIHEYNHG
jgi:glutamate synthase domain-containing protein 2